jgi:molybdenum cofactor cytidylyltransferase
MLFAAAPPRYANGMFRSFAVVPAAGQSARMGAPKLLLPLGGQTVIEHVLGAWTASSVTQTVVVVRADDAALIERCRQFPVELVTPIQAPLDMKASVALAMDHIAQRHAPLDNEAWLVAPADLPRLAASVIDAVIAAYDPAHPTAVAPVHRGLRGHPTLLPWSAAAQVKELAPHEGVNAVVARLPLREVACDLPGAFDDVDVPADYARLADAWPAPAAGGETGRLAPGFQKLP